MARASGAEGAIPSHWGAKGAPKAGEMAIEIPRIPGMMAKRVLLQITVNKALVN
jgi:hypothetical protein